MKKIYRGIALSIVALGLFQSCSYDKEMIDPLSNCADTINVSYMARVKPLLATHCYSCHGNGTSQGSVSIDTYDRVKQLALSGRLLGSISHTAGFAPMPLGAGKLSTCDITAVSTWIQEGTPNN